MKRVSLFLLTCCATINAKAQTNYDANLISKDLMPYASAVIRNEETTVEVKSKDKVITHVKKAITVFNKNGDRAARIVIYHNSNVAIRSVKGQVYNSAGIQTGKFSKSDLEDLYSAPDFNTFADGRVSTYMPSVADYPYTIAYDYETQANESLTISNWNPNSFPGLAVEKSVYSLYCKPDFKINYNEVNLPSKVVLSTTKDGLSSYTWTASNLKAMREEPFSPPNETYLSSLQIAPQSFLYNGVNGDFTDWTSLGKWVYDKLLTGRDILPESTIANMKALTNGLTAPKLKAKKIYEYMQKKTRYVSIQIGIGGLQPMFASDVDKLNYGDCKALVNYTQALLKAVGVESIYCVVQAGKPKVSMLPNFASLDQGNHIILCLPFKNDTTWLECTSQQIPFGFLSDFTDDRLVLGCTAQGGKLLYTPKYTADINRQIRKASFDINEQGELTGNMETIFKGVQYDDREWYISQSQTERTKALKRMYTINNLEINDLSYKQEKAADPVITESIKLTARDYAALSNNNFYFTVNAVNRVGSPPRELHSRTTPLYINEGYIDEDEITYKIPANYRLGITPLNVHLSKPFGTFDATITSEEGKLIYKRKMKMIDGTYSKDMYQDLVDFYKVVADADSYNATLVKKT